MFSVSSVSGKGRATHEEVSRVNEDKPRTVDLGTGFSYPDSRFGRFTSGVIVPCACWIGRWVGPRVSLKVVVKSSDLTGGNETLYRLSSRFKSLLKAS
jgi:hypothetical protein